MPGQGTAWCDGHGRVGGPGHDAVGHGEHVGAALVSSRLETGEKEGEQERKGREPTCKARMAPKI